MTNYCHDETSDMSRARTPRWIAVGLIAAVVGVVTACGATGPVANLPRLDGAPSTPHKGDISPRRVAQPLKPGDPKAATKTATPTPTVTLTPLPQPDQTYAAPKMPEGPSKSDPELDHIAYQLKRVVWASAGVVDPKTTKASCSKSENDIIQVGSYTFTCDVTLWGSSTRFQVKAKVNRSDVAWSWSAAKLPVSEDKAIHEATRQAFKPARVTCDVIDLELVSVGTRTGLSCWVTDIYNKSTVYRGELLPDGSLAFRPDS